MHRPSLATGDDLRRVPVAQWHQRRSHLYAGGQQALGQFLFQAWLTNRGMDFFFCESDTPQPAIAIGANQLDLVQVWMLGQVSLNVLGVVAVVVYDLARGVVVYLGIPASYLCRRPLEDQDDLLERAELDRCWSLVMEPVR